MKPVFYPYKMKSSSAKILAKALGSERVNPDGKFQNNYKRPIINWGNSEVPWWLGKWADQVVFNHPNAVKIAANKLLSFQKFKEAGVKHPEWTTDTEKTKEWETIVVRKTVTGKGGQGILIMEKGEDIPKAPLYTKYFKKRKEFRIHIFREEVIDFVEKKKRVGVENINYQIRNAGDWVFCREGVVVPDCVKEEAIKAVKSLGLTFGAVDIGYNERYNEPCVFEINTAPGIEGTTVDNYAKAIQKAI